MDTSGDDPLRSKLDRPPSPAPAAAAVVGFDEDVDMAMAVSRIIRSTSSSVAMFIIDAVGLLVRLCVPLIAAAAVDVLDFAGVVDVEDDEDNNPPPPPPPPLFDLPARLCSSGEPKDVSDANDSSFAGREAPSVFDGNTGYCPTLADLCSALECDAAAKVSLSVSDSSYSSGTLPESV